MIQSEDFFKFARERHSIYLARSAGVPSPWTEDPLLHKYRFTNVFRELDRTTIWFRENVREDLRDDPYVVMATVVFRFFNRISTGEVLFQQKDILSKLTPYAEFVLTGRADPIAAALKTALGSGPYVTGAYIVKTPQGYSKLDGVCWILEQFHKLSGWEDWVLHRQKEGTLQECWHWLREWPYIGDFTAYEIVSDLRHTEVLGSAVDVNAWANPGPGCLRGLRRVVTGGVEADGTVTRSSALDYMRTLLKMSRDTQHWPSDPRSGWYDWEMREVEHTLCEFDKYERARLGQGRPRGVMHK